MTKIVEESIGTEVVKRISISVVSNVSQEYHGNSMPTGTRSNKTEHILKAPSDPPGPAAVAEARHLLRSTEGGFSRISVVGLSPVFLEFY